MNFLLQNIEYLKASCLRQLSHRLDQYITQVLEVDRVEFAILDEIHGVRKLE